MYYLVDYFFAQPPLRKHSTLLHPEHTLLVVFLSGASLANIYLIYIHVCPAQAHERIFHAREKDGPTT